MESIGDDDIVTDGLDVERNIVAGQETIGEGSIVIVVVVVPIPVVVPVLVISVAVVMTVVLIMIVGVKSYGVKVAVVDIDAAFVEVGCIEVAVTVNEGAGETGVAGSIGCFDGDDGIDGGRIGAGCDGDVRVPSGIAPSRVAKRKTEGKPPGRTKSVGTLLKIVPWGCRRGRFCCWDRPWEW